MTKYLTDRDALYVSELTEAFRSWERCGRGWTVWDFSVDLEPPFARIKVESDTTAPVFDDARIYRGRNALVPHSAPSIIRKNVVRPNSFYRSEDLCELQVRPTSGLDVSTPIVSQFLLSLSSCNSPIAFELIANSKQIITQMACDRSFAPSLQNQLNAFFPAIVADEAPSYLSTLLSDRLPIAIADFGLGNNFLRTLMTFRSFSPDPLTGLITSLGGLQENQMVVFQVLFQGARGGWADEIQQLMRDPAAREIISEPNPTISEKLSSPLFACVARIAVQSNSIERSWNTLRTLGGNLAPFSNPSGNELIALSNDGLSNTNHLLSINTRTSYRSGMLLNAAELAGLVHIPSENIRSGKLVRSNARTKAAPDFAGTGSLVLGANRHNGRQIVVKLSTNQRLKHMHLVGATGSGKSTALIWYMLQDAAQDRGFACFDPHGDLIDLVIERIPDHRIKDVILFDPSDENFPIGFNIIAASSELEKTLLSSDLVSIFRKFSTSWGDVMNSVLANAILAFLESHRSGSLLDLKHFIIDRTYREEFLRTVQDDEIRYYWLREFPQIKGKPYGPLLTRLDTFLRSKIIRNIIAQKENKLDFRRILDEGKILLVRLAHGAVGTENSYMLGSLIVSKLYQAALSRQNILEAARRPYFLYLDEAHNFVTESMTQILSGARKFGLGLVTAHQQLRQFPPDILDSILGNSYTRICFRVDEDAERLAKGLSHFMAEDLKNLGVGTAVCRLEQSQFDFNLTTFPLDPIAESVAAARKLAVIGHSRKTYARPVSEVENELSVLRSSSVSLERHREPNIVKDESPPSDSKTTRSEAKTTAAPSHSEHRYLQNIVKRIGEDKGFIATIEKQVFGGIGKVDVALENGSIRIACEIAVTNTTEYEVQNIQKCLTSGFDRMVVISPDVRHLENIRKNAELILSPVHLDRVHFLESENFHLFLESLPDIKSNNDTEPPKVKGYKVRTIDDEIPRSEADAKKIVIRDLVSRVIRRRKRAQDE